MCWDKSVQVYTCNEPKQLMWKTSSFAVLFVNHYMNWISKLVTVCMGSIYKGLKQIIFYDHGQFSKNNPTYVKKDQMSIARIRRKFTTLLWEKGRMNQWMKHNAHFPSLPAWRWKRETFFFPQLLVRALFDYDPNEDPAIPCKDAAVAFKWGDVLQIVSMEDDTWWQACRIDDSNNQARLIPSRQLHERWPFFFLLFRRWPDHFRNVFIRRLNYSLLCFV